MPWNLIVLPLTAFFLFSHISKYNFLQNILYIWRVLCFYPFFLIKTAYTPKHVNAHTHIHTYVLMHKNISSDIACWRSNHKYYITVAYLHIPSFQRAFIFFDCLTSPWCFLDLQVHSMNYFSALRSFAFNQLTYVHMYMNYYTCIVYVCVCVYLFALCFYFNFIMF